MLATYFKRQTTQATYYSGPAGPYLDAFTNWLEQRGYRHETIRYRLQGAAQFVAWAQSTGCYLPSLSPNILDRFRCHLSNHHQLRHTSGPFSVRWLGAQRFFEFLQDQQMVVPTDTSLEATPPELLSAFEQWMQVHRGVRPSTLINYRPHIMELLIELGEDPERGVMNLSILLPPSTDPIFFLFSYRLKGFSPLLTLTRCSRNIGFSV